MTVDMRRPLGKWIQRWRKKNGIPRFRFAEQCHIGDYTVQRLEAGVGMPTKATLQQVFAVTGAPPGKVVRALEPELRARVIVAIQEMRS